MKSSKSKPEVQLQYGGRSCSKTGNSSISPQIEGYCLVEIWNGSRLGSS